MSTLVMVIQQKQGGAQPFSKLMLSLLNIQFSCQFRNHRSRSQFEVVLLVGFPNYFQFGATICRSSQRSLAS
jgi:hypothetical protein